MKTFDITMTAIVAAGLLAGCEQKVEKTSEKFNSMPPAVQKTVRASAPNAEIASVSKKTENGLEVYDVKYTQNGTDHTIVVAADGKVISSDTTSGGPNIVEKALTPTGATGTKFSALPLKVQTAIKSHSPADTEITDIDRQEKDGMVYYEIKFKNPDLHPTLRVTEDGTILSDTKK